MFEIALNPCAIDPSDTAFTSTQFVPRQIGFSAVVNDLVVNVFRRHIVARPNIYLGMVAKHLPEKQVVVEVKEALDFEIRVLLQLLCTAAMTSGLLYIDSSIIVAVVIDGHFLLGFVYQVNEILGRSGVIVDGGGGGDIENRPCLVNHSDGGKYTKRTPQKCQKLPFHR